MRVDFGLQRSGANDEERRRRLVRFVRAVMIASMIAGAGLVVGFALGLHDARWAGAWTEVAHASSVFSAPAVRVPASAPGGRG